MQKKTPALSVPRRGKRNSNWPVDQRVYIGLRLIMSVASVSTARLRRSHWR